MLAIKYDNGKSSISQQIMSCTNTGRTNNVGLFCTVTTKQNGKKTQKKNERYTLRHCDLNASPMISFMICCSNLLTSCMVIEESLIFCLKNRREKLFDCLIHTCKQHDNHFALSVKNLLSPILTFFLSVLRMPPSEQVSFRLYMIPTWRRGDVFQFENPSLSL